MSPFKSSAGRNLGKLVEGYKTSDIGKGLATPGSGGFSIDEDGTQGKPFTSINNAKIVGATNGLHYFQNPSVNSGNAFQLRYALYDGRGWVETFFSVDGAQTTPWDHFLTYVNGAARPTLQDFNLLNGGLEYASVSGSVVKIGAGFGIVDVAITSKSSRTGEGVTATGANQQNSLPLVASADLAGSQAADCRQALANFFAGTGTGFSVGGNVGGTPTEDYAAYWSKSGANPTGPFEIHLGFREGSQSTTEFHIADGNNSAGSTYAPNIGWRSSNAGYGGAFVGSWSSDTGAKASTYNISTSNVLSIWLSDSLT